MSKQQAICDEHVLAEGMKDKRGSSVPEERDAAAECLSGAGTYLFMPAHLADLSRAIVRATALTVEQRLIWRLELAGVELAERGAVL